MVFVNEEIIFDPKEDFSGEVGYRAFGVDGRMTEIDVEKLLLKRFAAAELGNLNMILNSSFASEYTASVEFDVSSINFASYDLYYRLLIIYFLFFLFYKLFIFYRFKVC